MPALLQRTSRSFAVSGAFAGICNRRRPWPRVDLCAALLALLGATASLGCATASEPPSTAKEAAVMTAPESASTAASPVLSADEIGSRFLKLIEGLESREDLSPDRVQEVLGLPLQRRADRGFSHYGQVQKNGWRTGLFLYDESPGHKRRVSLQIDQFEEGMPATACALGFAKYRGAFERMGFFGSPVHGEHGQLEYWHYYKPNDLVFQIVPQYAVPEVPGVAGPLCVRSIDMLD